MVEINSSIQEEMQQILTDYVELTATTFKMSGSNGENQDAFSCSSLDVNGENVYIIIVCDGHGSLGKFYSHNVINLLLNDENYSLISNIEAIIENSNYLSLIFEGINDKLDTFKNKLKSGGTTCTVLIITRTKIITANIGDCEAHIKFSSSIETIINDNSIESIVTGDSFVLTKDHSPKNIIDAEEILKNGHNIRYDLIKKSGGITPVYKMLGNKLTKIIYNDRSQFYYMNMNNEYAMYIDSKFGGSSNLTRSFGDKNYGFMKSTPDIKEIYYQANVAFTILTGTDGFFNSYKTEELNNLFMINGEYIVKDVVTTVNRVFGSNADNTTIISFKYFGSSY